MIKKTIKKWLGIKDKVRGKCILVDRLLDLERKVDIQNKHIHKLNEIIERDTFFIQCLVQEKDERIDILADEVLLNQMANVKGIPVNILQRLYGIKKGD